MLYQIVGFVIKIIIFVANRFLILHIEFSFSWPSVVILVEGCTAYIAVFYIIQKFSTSPLYYK